MPQDCSRRPLHTSVWPVLADLRAEVVRRANDGAEEAAPTEHMLGHTKVSCGWQRHSPDPALVLVPGTGEKNTKNQNKPLLGRKMIHIHVFLRYLSRNSC